MNPANPPRNASAATAGAPGQAQGQGQPGNPQYIRPEMVRNLPHLDATQKLAYEKGIRALYNAMQANRPDTPEHQQAQNKLLEISHNIRNSLNRWKQQQQVLQQQRAQQQQAQQAQQAQQGQQVQQPAPPALQAQQAQAAQQQAGLPQQAPVKGPMQAGQAGSQGAPGQAGSNWTPDILNHLQNFPFTAPPTLPAGSAESEKWVADAKQRYGNALHLLEQAKNRNIMLQNTFNARQQAGKPLTPEEQKDFTVRKGTFAKLHTEQKRFLDGFRQQQAEYKAHAQAKARAQEPSVGQGDAAPSSNVTTTQAGAVAAQNTAATAAASAASGGAARALGQQGSPAPTQRPNAMAATGSNQGTASNPALEAARAQAQNAGRGSASPTAGQAGSTATQPATSQPLHTDMSRQASGAQQSPQTAQQPGGAQAVPHALTHQDAMARAARSYSSTGPTATPTSASYSAHTHAQATSRESNTQKMPIPKSLHVAPVQAVAINAARPTLSGGPSTTNTTMGQPAVPKMPGYILEGEGERVLSKKKLEELVRQVTGGGVGGGETLTADVEEAVLTLADDFVDNVVTAACQLAKIRNSVTLEVRDIQLILERNYNIRVPGYASDEIRTVRKFAPAPGWTQKMSAIQAAKLSGGKTEL